MSRTNKTIYICPTNQDLRNLEERKGRKIELINVRTLNLNPDEDDTNIELKEDNDLGGFRIPYFNSKFDMYKIEIEMLPSDSERETIIKRNIDEYNLLAKIKNSNRRMQEYENKVVRSLVASSGLSENGYKEIQKQLNENFNTSEGTHMCCEDLGRYYEGRNQIFENGVTFSKYGLSKAELENAIDRAVSHSLFTNQQYIPLDKFIEHFTSCMRSTVGDYYCSFVVYDILGLRRGEKPVRSLDIKKKKTSKDGLVVHKTYERGTKQKKLRLKELQSLINQLNAWIGGRGMNSGEDKLYDDFEKCLKKLECGARYTEVAVIKISENGDEEEGTREFALEHVECSNERTGSASYYHCLFEERGTRFNELDGTRMALYTGINYDAIKQKDLWKKKTAVETQKLESEFKGILEKICCEYDYDVDIKTINEYERFFDVYPTNKLDNKTSET